MTWLSQNSTNNIFILTNLTKMYVCHSYIKCVHYLTEISIAKMNWVVKVLMLLSCFIDNNY